MNDKDNTKKFYNEIYDEIKPSDRLIRETSLKMKEELRKEQEVKRKSSNHYKRRILAITCSFVLFLGCSIFIYSNFNTSPNQKQRPDVAGNQDKILGKVAINISGTIERIENNGKKIKIGEKWIAIDENTEFSSQFGEDIEVSREFKIGNYVQGFTLDDINGEEVKALIIYSNEDNN